MTNRTLQRGGHIILYKRRRQRKPQPISKRRQCRPSTEYQSRDGTIRSFPFIGHICRNSQFSYHDFLMKHKFGVRQRFDCHFT